MKKLSFLFLLLSNFLGYAQYTLIPDVNFEKTLISLGIDSGAIDGKVLTTNVNKLTSLDVYNNNISNLTGIQDFSALTNLNFRANQLTNLDLSKNIALTDLNCSSNKLTNLDLSKNIALTNLDSSSNQLTNLDLSKNIALTDLDCTFNKLTDLNFSTNIALTNLNCSFNQLTNLDITENINLKDFDCRYNKLGTLDVSKITTLTKLLCSYNQINSLDISKSTDLWVFECAENRLINLDVSNNILLSSFRCENNQLTILDVSKNKFLHNFDCSKNNLSELNLKNGNNTHLSMSVNSFKDNPNLKCIQVDNASLSNNNSFWLLAKNSTTRYSEDCNAPIIAPTITSTTPVSRCNTGTVTLSATASGGIISWYDVPTGGTPLSTGTSFTTPNLTTTTKYYVDTTEDSSTTPIRTEIIATVNTIPTITSTTPASRCDTGTVTLGAIASDGIINWYDVPTGGTSLGTGTSFTTPNITSNTKYYVDASTPSCTTLTRTEIIATVNITPTITSTSPASRCDTGTVILGATASEGIINWYDIPNGGISLGTGTSFTTPNITSTTKYYVDASTTNCTTPTRTEIIATVNTSPTITSTTPASRCDTGTVTLEATASNGIINWYDVPTGGTSLGTGTSFTTPSIYTSSTFYADATDNNCPSPRTAIAATVFPVAKNNEEIILCESETVTLDASISGMDYLWSPGGETTQTIVVSSPGNYSVITSSPSVICNSKKDIKVVEHKNAIIKNIIIDENTITIVLNNPENYYEFSIDGKFFQNSNQFTHIPSGHHTAFARAKDLCDIVQQDFTIFTIPKFFTPNNDTFNDVWEIKEMKNYPKSSVLIFDRYGKLIKNLISSSPFWDGTYNNVALPADDYWYQLKLDDSKPELKGHFSLKR